MALFSFFENSSIYKQTWQENRYMNIFVYFIMLKVSQQFNVKSIFNASCSARFSHSYARRFPALCIKSWFSDECDDVYKYIFIIHIWVKNFYYIVYWQYYILCSSGWLFFLFVSNTLQNVWAQNFVWDLAWQQGRFMDAQNYKNLFLFDFVFVLYCTKRRSLQIKPQLKVEIEDGREAPWMPSII